MSDDVTRYGKLPCPFCEHPITRVAVTNGSRRNRSCVKCHQHFTTYEISEQDYRALQSIKEVIGLEAARWFPGGAGSKRSRRSLVDEAS